jgi:dienelactone hydrolase
MKHLFVGLLTACCFLLPVHAQEVITLFNGVPPGNGTSTVEEKVTKSADGTITGYSEVTLPTMTVYLPEPTKATGTAAVILPGGGLQFLSWDMEGVKLAKWLNEKGVAAFVLKYRLRTSDMKSTTPTAGASLRVAVYEADKLVNANANPAKNDVSTKVIAMGAEDARQAFRLIRQRASTWKINPAKIGCIGFSAGGGVELSGAMNTTEEAVKPNFIATLYGPALEDVVVPNPAPPLFIATCADHMNVAAGCLALFETWKKAGGRAEIHIYGKGRAGFGMNKQNQPSDEWVNSFYTWLVSEGF